MDEFFKPLPWWGYCIQACFAVGLLFSIVVWIADIVVRWREAKWAIERFTPEQYQDFLRRAGQAGVEYLRRSGGRVHFMDMVREDKDFEDDEAFDRELKARLRGNRR